MNRHQAPAAGAIAFQDKAASPFRNRQFLLMFAIAFLVYMSSSMLSQTLPKYANDLGATAQAVGLIAGVFQIAALSMRPVTGQIVDNENRVKMLRVVLAVILAAVCGLVLARDYWLLVGFRALHGLAWGVGSTLFMTIVTGCFTVECMTAGIGLYGLGQTLAQTIAPTFALPVAQRFGYGTLYIGNVALISACLVLSLFVKVDSPITGRRRYSYDLKRMIYLPATLPAMMTLCNSIAKAAIQAFLVIFAGTMDIRSIGIYFTLQAIVIFFTRPFLSKLADRYGMLWLLIPCEACIVIALVTISYAQSLPALLAASVIMGIGTSGEQPVLMAECVKSAPPEQRGNASNTSYVGTDAGGFIGSNLAGTAVALIGYRGMFRTFAIPVVAFTALYTVIRLRDRRIRPAEAPGAPAEGGMPWSRPQP